MKIIYIAGRYRHYRANGELDRDRMAAEVEDETKWAVKIAKAGHFWIAPLHNSCHVEQAHPRLAAAHYIQGDLGLVARLAPQCDGLLLRPGWAAIPEGGDRPAWYAPDITIQASEGAQEEDEAAHRLGLPVYDVEVDPDIWKALIWRTHTEY